MIHFHKEKRVEKVFSPRYSVAELHFIVFDSLKRPFESGQPPRRGYSVTTSTTVSVSPSIVKRTSSPSKLKP